MPSSEVTEETPLFTFGLVADIQYSDLDDGHTEGRTQRYREAPGKLQAATEAWKAHGNISCIVSLGDIINGNKNDPGRNQAELEEVACIFDSMGSMPVHHVIGNHCLSVPRDHILQRLSIPGSYYTVALPHGWQLLVLDTTEMSGHSGLPEDSKPAVEAKHFKEEHPLDADNPQMSDWNGGISSQQMRWLKEELQKASASGRRLIVAAHHQAGPGAARDTHLAWNWQQIHAAVADSRCTHVYMAGHDHMGGYMQDQGVHWVTIEGLLEAPSGGNAFAIVDVYNNMIKICGSGVTSRTLPLV